MACAKTTQTNVMTTGSTGRRRRIDIQHVQNVLLICLDSSIIENNDDCKNTISQLRRAVNDLNTYTDAEECVQFIQTIKDNKVCMIVSEALGPHVVPQVHDMSPVHSIFIFCSNEKNHQEWTQDWPKIKGVFTEMTLICEALKQAAQQCEHNATPISFVAFGKKFDQLDPSFIHSQKLKEILLTIDFDDEHIQEYVDYCREAYADHKEELKNIELLEQHYRDDTPIGWYTCECFLYKMLNRALRVMDCDTITRMGFFINDLHRHIEEVHKEQYSGQSSASTFTVYCGQGISKPDFDQLRHTKDALISFNSFLLTSKARSVSLGFAKGATTNSDLVGILFVMTIDPGQPTVPFVSVDKLSAIGREDEILFAMHSVFRVQDITWTGGNHRLYEVQLSLMSDNDLELRKLTDRIREESFPDSEGWYRLAVVLWKMGQLEKAEEICRTLLGQATRKSEKAPIYNQLGTIKSSKGEYQEAITFYEKGLAIEQQSLPPTHPSLASFNNNIGNLYYSMRNYSKALSLYEKALSIRLQALPPTHPDLASSYKNIGNVYGDMGDYSTALSYYKKDLAIKQQSLPSTHSGLAASYYNIALVYEEMGNYSEACAYLERTVQIGEQSLPANHPHLTDYRRTHERIKKKL